MLGFITRKLGCSKVVKGKMGLALIRKVKNYLRTAEIERKNVGLDNKKLGFN